MDEMRLAMRPADGSMNEVAAKWGEVPRRMDGGVPGLQRSITLQAAALQRSCSTVEGPQGWDRSRTAGQLILQSAVSLPTGVGATLPVVT